MHIIITLLLPDDLPMKSMTSAMRSSWHAKHSASSAAAHVQHLELSHA